MKHLIEPMRELALRYKAETGKPLGVTGELGELLAAQALGLTLAEARQPGWDGMDAAGRRYQIKSRVGVKGMMPSISLRHEFDAVLLVLLDPQSLHLMGCWEMSRAAVEAGLARPGSVARIKRGALAISWFKSNARKMEVGSAGPQPQRVAVRRDLSASLPFERLDDLGQDAELGPVIYVWRMGEDIYVGKSKNGVARAVREYANNIRRLRAGEPYRKSKPDKWRAVHLRLAEAVASGERITLELRSSSLETLNADEARLIADLGATLNRT